MKPTSGVDDFASSVAIAGICFENTFTILYYIADRLWVSWPMRMLWYKVPSPWQRGSVLPTTEGSVICGWYRCYKKNKTSSTVCLYRCIVINNWGFHISTKMFQKL